MSQHNRKLNWQHPHHEVEPAYHTPRLHGTALPAAVDLRPSCPPVYDQLDLGSCTAHACVAVVEMKQIEEQKYHGLTAILAVYQFTLILQGTWGQDVGSTISKTFEALLQNGLPFASLWPYLVKMFKKKPTPAVYASGAARKPTKKMQAPIAQDLHTIKATLAGGNGVAFGSTIYESFMSDETARTGVVPVPKKGERVEGGHALAIVGYDDAGQFFWVRNSWSIKWGLAGYCKWPYSMIMSKAAGDFRTFVDAPA